MKLKNNRGNMIDWFDEENIKNRKPLKGNTKKKTRDNNRKLMNKIDPSDPETWDYIDEYYDRFQKF